MRGHPKQCKWPTQRNQSKTKRKARLPSLPETISAQSWVFATNIKLVRDFNIFPTTVTTTSLFQAPTARPLAEGQRGLIIGDTQVTRSQMTVESTPCHRTVIVTHRYVVRVARKRSTDRHRSPSTKVVRWIRKEVRVGRVVLHNTCEPCRRAEGSRIPRGRANFANGRGHTFMAPI